MVRRAFWMLIGAGLGVWIVLRMQRAAARLTPRGVVEDVQRQVRHLRNDLAAALADGRRAKRAAEVDLRQAARVRPVIDISIRPGLSPASPTEEIPVGR